VYRCNNIMPSHLAENARGVTSKKNFIYTEGRSNESNGNLSSCYIPGIQYRPGSRKLNILNSTSISALPHSCYYPQSFTMTSNPKYPTTPRINFSLPINKSVLSGKSALITGGASGIGEALVIELATAGFG